jgi:hypothetical protein
MAAPLLVVKDAFPARGGGVEVLPPVGSDRLPPSPFVITLRAPDGAERRASATAVVAHMRGPLPPFAMLRLAGVDADAVPPGTELWLEE